MEELNKRFLGGQVALRRERLERLLNEIHDEPQIRVLDETIGRLEKRKAESGKRADYKPGAYSDSGN